MSQAGLVDAGVQCDAVFGLNDALALGAMYELLIRGFRVPEQVAVAGFDDIDEARYLARACTLRPGSSSGSVSPLHRFHRRWCGVLLLKGSRAERCPRDCTPGY